MKREFENSGFGGPAFKRQNTEPMPPSRALFVAGFGQAYITQEMLQQTFAQYGPVVNVHMKPEKGIAFVNMTSVDHATAAKNHAEQYGIECGGKRLVVKFGKDNSNSGQNQNQGGYGGGGGGGYQQQNQGGYGGPPGNRSPYGAPPQQQLPPGWVKSKDPASGKDYYYNSALQITQWEPPAGAAPPAAPAPAPMGGGYNAPQQQQQPYGGNQQPYGQPQQPYGNGGPGYGGPGPMGGMGGPPRGGFADSIQGPGSRGIFVGNLPDDCSYSQLCQIGNPHGAIDSVRLNPDKRNAFINFVDPQGAMSMFNAAQYEPPRIGHQMVRIGWAKSAPIRADVAMAVANGATRSLYINLKEVNAAITEDDLKMQIAPFCNNVFDSIQVNHEKQFAFVNLVDLLASIKAHSHFMENGLQLQGFPAKVGFANDRASRPARKPDPNKTISAGESRAIFLGNLPPGTSYTGICDLASPFGELDLVHINYERGNAFVNYITTEAAAALHSSNSTTPLQINGTVLRVGWAKSNDLKPELKEAIDAGAHCMLTIKGLHESVPEQTIRSALAELTQNMLCKVTTVDMTPEEIAAAEDEAAKFKSILDLGTVSAAVKIKDRLLQKDPPVEIGGVKLVPVFTTDEEIAALKATA